LIVDRLN